MCGRYALYSDKGVLSSYFEVEKCRQYPRSFNIPPGTNIPICRYDEKRQKREITAVRWGLIPGWADDERLGNKLINARAETVDKKPSFKDSFRKRRCLIPANGFFEWKPTGQGKQPYFIYPDDSPLLAFAGIWSAWVSPTGKPKETCAIITKDAPDSIADVHHRAPAVIERAQFDTWLEGTDSRALKQRLVDSPYPTVACHPVSPNVNNPDADYPEVVEPLESE